ncbi:hypothetical protein [Thalassococcus sp. S3]|uniref:hypothetical protein n=1 Tax=Thalassococcus sp. S3 TaxID=2017482 RepID=UPI0010241902|nr:hypothetical protein [Thalassococcus sp. S3]QBF32440.1 hypothetical protein CFI11_14625 [Thalassococcus sp. S3]
MKTLLWVMALMLSAQICSAESLVGTWRCELIASTDPDFISNAETVTYLPDGSLRTEVTTEYQFWDAPISLAARATGTWVLENSTLQTDYMSLEILRLTLSGNDHTDTPLAESMKDKVFDLDIAPATITYDGSDRFYYDDGTDRQMCHRIPERAIS